MYQRIMQCVITAGVGVFLTHLGSGVLLGFHGPDRDRHAAGDSHGRANPAPGRGQPGGRVRQGARAPEFGR